MKVSSGARQCPDASSAERLGRAAITVRPALSRYLPSQFIREIVLLLPSQMFRFVLELVTCTVYETPVGTAYETPVETVYETPVGTVQKDCLHYELTMI